MNVISRDHAAWDGEARDSRPVVDGAEGDVDIVIWLNPRRGLNVLNSANKILGLPRLVTARMPPHSLPVSDQLRSLSLCTTYAATGVPISRLPEISWAFNQTTHKSFPRRSHAFEAREVLLQGVSQYLYAIRYCLAI